MKPHFSSALARYFSPWMLVLVCAGVALGAYLQALDYPFIADDNFYITANTKLIELHFTELWRLLTKPYNTVFEFLPLRELSYWFDMTLFGLNPSWFRLHNIVLYLLCLPLVYVTTSWLWRYFRPAEAGSALWVAGTITALFALHPSHAEAVVWIAGRKDVLSTLFSLLALWLAMNAKREHGLSVPYATATQFVLLAAMLSKASAVSVAPVIALLWVMFWRDIPVHNRRFSILLWPVVSIVLAACIATIFATITTQRIPFYFGIEVVTRTMAVLGWLARLSVSPESRHFFYPVLDDPYLPAMVALGVAVLAAVTAGALLVWRKRSLEGFALVAFFLLCVPSLQLIPYSPPSLVSDRWLALAIWPVLLLIVALAWRLKPFPRTALLLAFALSWCFQTIERPRDWSSFEAVTDADSRAYPWYYIPAMYKIVNDQLPHGLVGDARNTADRIAAPEFRELMIKLIDAEHALHVDAIATGKPQKAMDLLWQLGLDLKHLPDQAKWNPPVVAFYKYCPFRLTIEWKFLAKHFPDDVSVNYNTGLWLLNVEEYKQATVHLRTAVESQHLPESMRGSAFKNLGIALIKSGRIDESEAPLRAALEQSPPDFRAYCLLSDVYKRTGRIEESARAETECRSHILNEKITS